MSKVIEPLTLDITRFKKRFHQRVKYRWSRPSIWLISHEVTALYRQLEIEVIVRLFEQAKYVFKLRWDIWSKADRLEEIRTLADFAVERNIAVMALIENVLMLEHEECRKWLEESGWKGEIIEDEITKVFNNRSSSAPHLKSAYSQLEVDRAAAHTMKACSGKLVNKECAGVTPANHDLCWSCHQIYGFTREEYPKWLLFMVRDDRKEYRRQVSETLYFAELPSEEAAA